MIVQAYTVSVLTQGEVRGVSRVWVCRRLRVCKWVCSGLLFEHIRDEQGYLYFSLANAKDNSLIFICKHVILGYGGRSSI